MASFDQSRFISKLLQDGATATTDDEYELVCDLSNGAVSMTLSDLG